MRFRVLFGLGLLFAGLLCLPVTATAQTVTEVTDPTLVAPKAWIDWNKRVAYARGLGVLTQQTGSMAQKRMLAQRVAMADAYRHLAILIYGSKIHRAMTVDELGKKYEIIKTSVSGLIPKASIENTQYSADGSVEITVALGLDVLEKQLSAHLRQAVFKNKLQELLGQAQLIGEPQFSKDQVDISLRISRQQFEQWLGDCCHLVFMAPEQ